MSHASRIILPTLLIAAFFVVGCGKKQPSPQQEASQSIEQAGNAIDQMKKERQSLKDDLKSLHEKNQQMLKKHFALLETRLEDYKKRMTALPADAEKNLQSVYQKLQEKMNKTRSLGQKWLAASGPNSDDLKQQFKDASDELDVARDDFEKKLANAESSNETGK